MKPTPTHRQHFLDDSNFIVSKTDPMGIITYVNLEFLRISQYSEAELLGKPHNIIRHPETPSAIFFHLWETLRQGHSWQNVIKNMAKDGGFYWVDSLITPSLSNGKLIGYMSVRRKPSLLQIQEAERLYASKGGLYES